MLHEATGLQIKLIQLKTYRNILIEQKREFESSCMFICTADPLITLLHSVSFCYNVDEKKTRLPCGGHCLCETWMCSSCLCGFSGGTLVSSYIPEMYLWVGVMQPAVEGCLSGVGPTLCPEPPMTLKWDKWIGKELPCFDLSFLTVCIVHICFSV